jgi:hypothetical protein
MPKAKRRPWGKWFAVAAAFVGALFLLVHYFISNSDAFVTASSFVRGNPEVQRVAGTIQNTSLSWGGGEVEVSGDTGHAQFSVKVTGSLASPRVYVELAKRGTWEILNARLFGTVRISVFKAG